LPRSFGSLNVVDRIDSAAGARSAPNAPWQARAMTSMPKLVAAPPDDLVCISLIAYK
jgi:hypothetical protein